ncbi:MAG: hypothetical protein AAFX44_16810 [Pseudomonadota bacterium]
MAFSGMTSAEFDDVQRLNLAFLELGRTSPECFAAAAVRPPEACLERWRNGEIARAIAALPVPYFLFRVAVDWDARSTPTLFAPSDSSSELAVLALAFMQRLGRRERFGLRVVTGVTDAEAARLLATSVSELGRLARSADQPIVPALTHLEFFWPDLILATANGNIARLRTLLSLGHHHQLQRAGSGEHEAQRAARRTPPPRRIADIR